MSRPGAAGQHPAMEPLLQDVAETVALACELVAVGFVAAGAAEALTRTIAGWRRYGDLRAKKDIWLRFAAAIILSLEFALAADIARTAIAPTWFDIGKLAAIAAIRTLLNLFLERDLEAQRSAS
jgi:uncharacterized membrane protein